MKATLIAAMITSAILGNMAVAAAQSSSNDPNRPAPSSSNPAGGGQSDAVRTQQDRNSGNVQGGR
jgi:hypothetical protein